MLRISLKLPIGIKEPSVHIFDRIRVWVWRTKMWHPNANFRILRLTYFCNIFEILAIDCWFPFGNSITSSARNTKTKIKLKIKTEIRTYEIIFSDLTVGEEPATIPAEIDTGGRQEKWTGILVSTTLGYILRLVSIGAKRPNFGEQKVLVNERTDDFCCLSCTWLLPDASHHWFRPPVNGRILRRSLTRRTGFWSAIIYN